ncbi:sel1 repeat family protein [Agarilytica rhodophyticola]|uniref:sel1 repeat family protein n=1 Tax=Agarilytica rhodophyticola TaxID=1737490 RepID=UPI000B343E49|nr:sel1 repeat family protein [Agarilytica rhodophyticola]
MNKEEIVIADKIYEEGSMSDLYEFIKPFLEKDDPHAFHYYSCFSLSEWNETDIEFDKRCVESLLKAAEGNVPEAMYRLSTLYFSGDSVELNAEIGKKYLDHALEMNLGLAKLSVGVNTYYGSNGYVKDLDKAIEFVSEAVKDNVDGASETLEKIKAVKRKGDGAG